MNVASLFAQFKKQDICFFAGVPDSLLKPLCNYLLDNFGVSNDHVIAVNEGNAVAIAAGYYLSTGKIPCVYLQNSGIGNIINPVASLLSDKVYGIPCVFVIGWRGAPNMPDEPQHKLHGEVTLQLLEMMNIEYRVMDQDTTESKLENWMGEFRLLLDAGKSVAFVVKNGALYYDKKVAYRNNYCMLSEDIIHHITQVAKSDVIVSTTGKISRELFEIRESHGQSHKFDFLTVGAMGHSSAIALGVAMNKPNLRVWCIDGDGSALMHMGSIAIIGAKSPGNYIHVIINNEVHESVGGQPTIAESVNLMQVALACGYKTAYCARNFTELDAILSQVNGQAGPILIEVKSAIGARDDLGRPVDSLVESKKLFMEYLKE
jgi:phosphonopyruvate decarboxylase